MSYAGQSDDDLHRPSRVAHIAIIAIQRPFMKRTVPEIGLGRKGHRRRVCDRMPSYIGNTRST